jgi:hypothetical protein
VELHGRQPKLLCNVGVLDGSSLVQAHPLDLLRDQGAAGNCASTSESLEFDFADLSSRLVDVDLQLHDIAARRCTNEPGTDVRVIFVQRTNVARAFVVVNDLKLGSNKAGEEGEKVRSRFRHRNPGNTKAASAMPRQSSEYRMMIPNYAIERAMLLQLRDSAVRVASEIRMHSGAVCSQQDSRTNLFVVAPLLRQVDSN